MGEIAKIMMCHDWKKQLFIQATYMEKKHTYKTYLLNKEYIPSKKITSLSLLTFTREYIPKVGKFELQTFLAEKLLHALYITKDLTFFFNMEVYFNDNGEEYYLTSSDIRRLFLPLFIESTFDDIIFLTFKEQKL